LKFIYRELIFRLPDFWGISGPSIHPSRKGTLVADTDRLSMRRVDTGETISWAEFCAVFRPGEGEPEQLWEVDYALEELADRYGETLFGQSGEGIFRFWPLLPVGESEQRLSLQEGNTPLLATRHYGQDTGVHYFLKNECRNPTGSFKDRYDCVSINVARALGFKRVVCASTGNHALSVATYAAAAGMGCQAIVADSISEQVLATLKICGSEVRVVSPTDRFEILAEAGRSGAFPVGLFMPGPTSNPFGIEGYKTIAYEIFEQLGKVPDAVIFPCARGNGLYGTWKGFQELRTVGLLDRSPRMYACQPSAGSSLVQAFDSGWNSPGMVEPGYTIADAICETVSSQQALDAIYTSGGAAVSVGEDQIVEAMFQLGSEGVFAEPSSAAALAGASELNRRNLVGPGDHVVVVITSSGLKSNRAACERILG